MCSLRWEVNPQNGLNDEASMMEWRNFFSGVGLRLQELVLKCKRQKMTLLDKKIADKLDPIKDTQ